MALFPELTGDETVIPQLVRTEVDVRRQCGVPVEQDEIARRFPDRLPGLSDLFGRSKSQPPADGDPPASRETVRPTSNSDSAAETPADKADPIPEKFGRYRVIRQLGEGAMGVVYLAKDTQLQRNVALKTPTFLGVEAAELIERFYREARSSATLRHANICPVYDVGEIDGRHYISMAFIEGRTLSRFIRSGKQLPQRTAAALVRKLSRALGHAHDESIIHRDLKPGNVMIDRQNEPIIMDFGLARRIDQSDQSRVTQEGMILGTPAYMSPEQVSDKLDATGPHSDIYSLGVMCYELLTGEIPFGGPIMAVLAQIMTQEPLKPSELRPDLDPQLAAICLKMMAKKLEDRYRSMKEVSAALAAYLKGTEPASEKPVPSPAGQQPAAKKTPAATETGQQPSVRATMVGDGEMQALAEMFAAQSADELQVTARAQRRSSRSSRASKKMWIGLSIAAVSLVLLMGIVISIETDKGWIKVKVPGSLEDASIRVVIDETEYKIGRGSATIKLEPGQHNVTIFRDGKRVGSQTLLVVTGIVNAVTVPAPPLLPLPNIDREVAQWLYDTGSYFKVRSIDGRLLSFFRGKKAFANDLPESRLVITYISYRGAAATDDDMKNLRDLTSLETLTCPSGSVTGRGIEQIKHLPRLKTLDLRKSRISDDGYRVVAQMRQLQTLSTNDLIGNSGLAHLSGMVGLTSLTISSKLITDAGLEHLSSLKNLEILHITNGPITGTGLVHPSKMNKLRILSLENTMVGDAGLVHLETLSSLRTLVLSSTNVTDSGMQSVGKLTGLEGLYLSQTVIGDAGAEHLGNLLQLENLYLDGTRVGNEGLRHLSEARKISYLVLNSTRIDDTGLVHLRNMTGLRRFHAARTEITGAGLEPLTRFANLSRLELGGGKFTEKAAALESLKQMYGLSILWLPGVTLTRTEITELRQALGRGCKISVAEFPEEEEDSENE